MAIKPRRDKPLPEGLVHGITSIRFKSSLKPAEPPKTKAIPNSPEGEDGLPIGKENDDEEQAEQL